VSVEHQHHVGADALRVIARRGEDGGRVAAGYRLTKSEVRSQHGHTVCQLAGAEADQVLGEGPSRTQLLGRPRLDGLPRADEHCGKRHSLRDDHQTDDQEEKPVAETAHESRSNRPPIVRGPQ
jgi:hypothetical protein